MKILNLTFILLLGAACYGASSQATYSDNLTTIDSTKWSQVGSLSSSATGVSGSGALVSTVAIPTANDYDISTIIHTPNQGKADCTSSYSLYARATPDATTAYVLTASAGSVGLYREVAGSWTLLSWQPFACTDGSVMRMVVKGSAITFWSGPNTAAYQDSTPIVAGHPGVGIVSTAGDTIGNVKIGAIGYVAPAAVVSTAIQTSLTPHRVDIRWPAAVTDATSAGLQGYVVYRDGVYLGSPRVAYWTDFTVSGPETTTYSISAIDQHGNLSEAATVTVNIPEGLDSGASTPAGAQTNLRKPTAHVISSGPTVDQREVGVRTTGTYWGAAGENIDLLSGNLNFSIPLFKAMGRGSSSVSFAISYNSQMWRQDSGGVWLLGADVGVGLGWTLQAGSIFPVWSGSTLLGYLYMDSTGAQYTVDQQNGSVWSSQQAAYVWFDSSTDLLHFRDGSFWNMNVISASTEQDAGTIYPSQMEDTNGNYIQLAYLAAVGYPWYSTNTSSRIYTITDPRANPAGFTYTYSLSWSGTGLPHLTGLTNYVGTTEKYTFTTAAASLYEPFTGGYTGSTYVLQSAAVTGLGIAHQFQYNNSAELTQVTTPLGGVLSWAYRQNNYTARSYREVQYRYMQAGPTSPQYSWTMNQDGNGSWHTSTTMVDNGASSQKAYTFSGTSDYTAGLVTQYQEIDPTSTVLLQKTYAWTRNSSLNPYMGAITTTLNPGQSYAATTTSQPQQDGYGNVTSVNVSDYAPIPGFPTTGTRTYYMTYTASNPTFAVKYIFNRQLGVSVTPLGGSNYSISTTSYDLPCWGGMIGLTPSNAVYNHDSAFGTSYTVRGNPASTTGLNGADAVCTAYDTAGVPYYSVDANGHSVSIGTTPATDYSLPYSVQPNANSGMQTSATYASSWAPATMTGPNGDQGTTTYDTYGRPSQTTIPDGATTTYTYTYSAGASTQTATVNGRFQTTTLDGFGRTLSVKKGNGTTVVSEVDTDYAPCACSPLTKMYRVSQPYAPGGTVYRTVYAYDGSGRTLTITAADGQSKTQYSYQGNSTTATDPAGKWKTSTVDAYGNLILMTEPNPAGGANFTTSYAYNSADQLTTVTMPRSTGTQTRSFTYSGSDLLTATNPENGTVTYTYDSSHHILTRTDAIGYKTQFSYDSYGRKSTMQYFDLSNNEYLNQRVTYYYDATYPCTFSPASQSGTGRLTGIAFGGGMTDAYHDSYCYMYAYNQAGRVLTQAMAVNGAYLYYNKINFSATYQWDNEGRMTSLGYPTVLAYGSFGNMPATMPTEGLQYDANGQLNQITMDSHFGSGPQPIANATYTAPGQLYQLSHGPWTETRTYNAVGQLTNQSVPYAMNLTYNYSATQNNGRITGSVDAITGESTSYSYDALNRLTGASNSLWSQGYSYDGFGNLTAKTGANAMSTSYDVYNHQSGASYDANGNQIGCGSGCYNTYNVENRLVWQTTSTTTNLYAYDPSGKRVMSGSDPSPYLSPQPVYTYSFYSITGQRLATLKCDGTNYPSYANCTITGQNVYFGGQLIVSEGVHVLTDRLGSVRSNAQGEAFAYYPYGEERTSTVDGREKFGTYFRDIVPSGYADQDYADKRYYTPSAGRFTSTDPLSGSGNLWIPASLNRFSYVGGDPINFSDPSGLCWVQGVWYPDPCFAVTTIGTTTAIGSGSGNGASGDGVPCGSERLPEPGCTPSSGGGGGGLSPTQMKAIQDSIRAAVQDLNLPECQALFGNASTRANGFDPQTLLIDIFGAGASGNAVSSMTFGSVPITTIYENVGLGLGYTMGFKPLISSTGLVVIMNTSGGLLSGNDNNDIEITMLHELGHIYNLLPGSGGSPIGRLGDFTGRNNDLINQDCVAPIH